MTLPTLTPPSPRSAVRRLRPRLLPIAQTALAAVVAYYVALVLPLDDGRPTFASIAAVICLGATYRHRGRRAVELSGGVVLGLIVADLIIRAIGVGPLQIGLMIVLAMAVAVVLGGGELFVNEAAISGLIIVSLVPAAQSAQVLSLDRPIEALVGGAVALLVGSLVFPPDPRLLVARPAQRVFGDLGWSLREAAAALDDGDPGRADGALRTARSLDELVEELEQALATAHETVRFAPPRRAARTALARYDRTVPHLDFAVRNTRILARHAARYARSRLGTPEGLAEAVRELAQAVWMLADAYDDPARAGEARGRALLAAAHARDSFEREPDLVLTEIVAQVRSTAVDLVRIADLVVDEPDAAADAPTEELLAAGAAPA